MQTVLSELCNFIGVFIAAALGFAIGYERKQEDGHIRCSVKIFTATEYYSAKLTEIMNEKKFILSIVREDDD